MALPAFLILLTLVSVPLRVFPVEWFVRMGANGNVPTVGRPAERQAPVTDCDRMSRELFGAPPQRFGADGLKPKAAEPKKLHDVRPQFPAQWPKGCHGTASVHEALIVPSGKVGSVWTLKAPCKEMDEAVRTAVRQWIFAPTMVDGHPLPACMVVSTLVDLR